MKEPALNKNDQLAMPGGKWLLAEENIVLETPGYPKEKSVFIEPKMLVNPEMLLTILRHPYVDKNEFLKVYFEAIEKNKIRKIEIEFIKSYH